MGWLLGSSRNTDITAYRLRTCQEYIDSEGHVQQSLNIETPNNYQGNSPCINSRLRSPSPMPEPTQQQRSKFRLSATMPKNNLEKRTVSPHRFPLLRSGSFSSKPTTPKTSRSTTPNQSRPTLRNSSFGRHQPQKDPSRTSLIFYTPQKSASMRFPDRENVKDMDQIPSKSKRLLKALLSRRKSKNDDTLYTYLDEYT
ncbi:hypothetical protein Leryth_027164 [Lithospermum erythrorhizon]|nr:hypothetical protein Leryth_027164 [Lithospermum erythrorhizon]